MHTAGSARINYNFAYLDIVKSNSKMFLRADSPFLGCYFHFPFLLASIFLVGSLSNGSANAITWLRSLFQHTKKVFVSVKVNNMGLFFREKCCNKFGDFQICDDHYCKHNLCHKCYFMKIDGYLLRLACSTDEFTVVLLHFALLRSSLYIYLVSTCTRARVHACVCEPAAIRIPNGNYGCDFRHFHSPGDIVIDLFGKITRLLA